MKKEDVETILDKLHEIQCNIEYIKGFIEGQSIIEDSPMQPAIKNKVTLKVLKKKKAWSGFLDYFNTLEKEEWDVVELIERCVKDWEFNYAGWLWKCVDEGSFDKESFDEESFERVVECCIENKWGLSYAFAYCHDLFTQELFERVVESCIENGWGLGYAFKYCYHLPFFQEVMDRLGVKNPKS